MASRDLGSFRDVEIRSPADGEFYFTTFYIYFFQLFAMTSLQRLIKLQVLEGRLQLKTFFQGTTTQSRKIFQWKLLLHIFSV